MLGTVLSSLYRYSFNFDTTPRRETLLQSYLMGEKLRSRSVRELTQHTNLSSPILDPTARQSGERAAKQTGTFLSADLGTCSSGQAGRVSDCPLLSVSPLECVLYNSLPLSNYIAASGSRHTIDSLPLP